MKQRILCLGYRPSNINSYGCLSICINFCFRAKPSYSVNKGVISVYLLWAYDAPLAQLLFCGCIQWNGVSIVIYELISFENN